MTSADKLSKYELEGKWWPGGLLAAKWSDANIQVKDKERPVDHEPRGGCIQSALTLLCTLGLQRRKESYTAARFDCVKSSFTVQAAPSSRPADDTKYMVNSSPSLEYTCPSSHCTGGSLHKYWNPTQCDAYHITVNRCIFAPSARSGRFSKW